MVYNFILVLLFIVNAFGPLGIYINSQFQLARYLPGPIFVTLFFISVFFIGKKYSAKWFRISLLSFLIVFTGADLFYLQYYSPIKFEKSFEQQAKIFLDSIQIQILGVEVLKTKEGQGLGYRIHYLVDVPGEPPKITNGSTIERWVQIFDIKSNLPTGLHGQHVLPDGRVPPREVTKIILNDKTSTLAEVKARAENKVYFGEDQMVPISKGKHDLYAVFLPNEMIVCEKGAVCFINEESKKNLIKHLDEAKKFDRLKKAMLEFGAKIRLPYHQESLEYFAFKRIEYELPKIDLVHTVENWQMHPSELPPVWNPLLQIKHEIEQ